MTNEEKYRTVEERAEAFSPQPPERKQRNEIACKFALARSAAAHKRELSAKDDERLTIVATYENVIADKDAKIAELRECLKVAEDALEKIDNMCDGDMCKCFDNTHHCSACRYLESCQTGVAHAALHEIREKGGANNGSKNEKAGRQPVTDCNCLGNAAKMRDALEKADVVLSLIYKSAWFIDANFSVTKAVIEAGNAIEAALAAPPRNCDRTECATTKAAQEVWRMEDAGKTAFYEWLLATSTKGESK